MKNYGPIMKLLPIKDKYIQISHEVVKAENQQKNIDKKLVSIEKKIEKQKLKYFKAQNEHYTHELEEVFKKGGLTKQNALIAFVIFRSMEG
jgi:energy-coupling factor transporter ATP-binding protein EcfA2